MRRNNPVRIPLVLSTLLLAVVGCGGGAGPRAGFVDRVPLPPDITTGYMRFGGVISGSLPWPMLGLHHRRLH